MKPTKIKAWPELVDFQPSLIAIRDVKPIGTTKSLAEIDFGSVRRVSATGLTVFLLRVFGVLAGRPPLRVLKDGAEDMMLKLEELGAFHLINELSGTVEGELPFKTDRTKRKNVTDQDIISIPVYHIKFQSGVGRRSVVHKFKVWLMNQLQNLLRTYDKKAHALVLLLGEIAKNTADHTTMDALFGIDLVTIDANKSKLTFAFGDLGEGIKRNVEKHICQENPERLRHMSLYEPYRLALTPGFTSKEEAGTNKGHGMTIIIDCANDLGAHLSIFDAASRGLLSAFDRLQKPSHSAVRRIFHSVGHHVGFFYYGEITLTKKSEC